MVVNQILNKRIIFVIVFLETRYSFFKNLKLALDIKCVTRNNLTFYRNSKTRHNKNYLITTFLLVRKNLKDITNRSDSIGIALLSNS